MTDETCLYLYGVIVPGSIEESGTGNVFRGMLRGMPRGEEDASEVFLIEAGNLACVASSVLVSEYSELRGDASNQPEWLGPRALRHHEILRNLHEVTTVVPFKFGTLCRSTREVEQVLQQLHQPFTSLLRHFAGREEWGVRVMIEQEVTMSSLEKNNPQLSSLLAPAPNQPPGEIYFLQKRRRQLTAGLMDELVFSLSEQIEQRLMKSVIQIACNAENANQRNKSKITVLNAAVLLDKTSFTSLETILEQLECEYSSYALTTEISGPWPPYTFSTHLEDFQNSSLCGSPQSVF